MQGDRTALRICMERIIPARRGGCIRMNLPAGDVDQAAEKVTQALRRGDITPTEGGILMNALEILDLVGLEAQRYYCFRVPTVGQARL